MRDGDSDVVARAGEFVEALGGWDLPVDGANLEMLAEIARAGLALRDGDAFTPKANCTCRMCAATRNYDQRLAAALGTGTGTSAPDAAAVAGEAGT